MRVGIDARIANYGASGIARYTKGVIAGLCEAIAAAPQLSVVVLTALRKRYPLVVPWPLLERALITPPHFCLEAALLPLELRVQRIDLLHCMDFFAPHPRSLRTIYSIHDLCFVKDPDQLSAASRRHYLGLLRRLPNARHLVCISHDTRRELLTLSSIPPERVSVIYPGCEPIHQLACPSDVAQLGAKLSIASSCVLFVGTVEPRKNIPNMVAGYTEAAKILGSGALPPFVIVGRNGYRADEIISHCRKLAFEADVRFTGELSDKELASLYRVAKALLFVTAGEGFGFPIVEAMHAGVPVITSNRSASAEVVGDAALKVDPDDPAAIAQALVALYSSTERPLALRTAGYVRAQEFSWTRCGKQLCELYLHLGQR